MKLLNDYIKILCPEDSAFYDSIPKAVWAALAISPFVNGGGDYPDGGTLDTGAIRIGIHREWLALYNAGIVPQKPFA